MKLTYVKADPSGNITLFVLTPVPLSHRKEINALLLSLDKEAEQVGCLSFSGTQVNVEMMGGEFCGNATRSAAAYCASLAETERGNYQVTCSGCARSLPVSVRRLGKGIYDAEVELPLPLSLTKESLLLAGKETEVIHVVLPGIDHYVCFTDCLDSLDKEACWKDLERQVLADTPPEAFGLILVEEKTRRMVPAVFVTATKTLYWERSCGSGSAAAAAALADRYGKTTVMTLEEPGGPIRIRAEIEKKALRHLFIGGPVALFPPKQLIAASFSTVHP